MHETGMGQQVAQLHERLMMMMMIIWPEPPGTTAANSNSGHLSGNTNCIQELDTKCSDTCWKVRHCVVAAQTEAQLLLNYGVKHSQWKLR